MVAPVLVTLLGSAASAVVSKAAEVLFKFGERGYEASKSFQDDIGFIQRELLMIAGSKEDELAGKGYPSAVKSISMEEMRDLAFDIEDCLDRIRRWAVESEGEPVIRRGLGQISNLLIGPPYADEIQRLKKRLMQAHQRGRDFNVDGSQPSAAAAGHASASPSSPANTSTTTKMAPVGIDGPRRELEEMLLMDVEGQPEQLRVISIVGFSGSGKSTIARAVYDSPDVVGRFPCRAWLRASEQDGGAEQILTALFEELRLGDPTTGNIQDKISDYLSHHERYLIVLDDIKDQNCWHRIKSAFPEKTRSRIIVTTTVQTVAKVFSSGNADVLNMRALDAKNSKELLKALLKCHSAGFEHQSSMSILHKCDGHPLALVTLANYLKGVGVVPETCEKLCHSLGFQLATEDAFKQLREVLMDNYRSLPKEFLNLKTCLLYVCVFPNGCDIRRSRLIRRWFAEGYVQHDFPRSALDVADAYLKKLVERSIIWSIDASNNENLKTCRAHGIFHEFLLHMSKSAKFITSFENSERRNYRHIYIHNTSPAHGGKSGDDKEKLRAHSLTVYGSAGEAVGHFDKYELLRVLDLEQCDDLTDRHADAIPELWHLRYLSLGASSSRLPREIEKLYCLVTLDVRKTKKEIELPVEVIKLPHLAHLLGRFKLDKRNWGKSKPEKFVPEKNNLQTLAGFVTDNNPGFPMLMVHMKQLRKVKIWRSSTPEDSHLSNAINNFVQAEQDTCESIRSLSLDIGNLSGIFLRDSLSYGCLRTLKLHGELRGLIQFVALMYSIKELCLSSTNELVSDDLSNLRKLRTLEYLKLVKVTLGDFTITNRDFPLLRHLCLVECPSLPTIEEGALPKLLSLRLLKQDLADISGIEIRRHEHLQEVALDYEISQAAKTVWEDAAKNHPKRPRILYLQRVVPDGTGSIVKYVSAKRAEPGMGSSIVKVEPQVPVLQSNSPEESNSALEHVHVARPYVESTEPRSAMNTMMPSSSRVVS